MRPRTGRLTSEPHRPAHSAARSHQLTGSALARHVALTMAWGPLVAGCLAGIGVMIALRIGAGRIETATELGVGIRASFVPVAAAVAFLLPDAQRPLIATLPVRAWLTSLMRLVLALPVLGLTGAVEALLADRALAADLRVFGPGPAPLPWLALSGELAAWSLLALALAAGIARTRWHDLAGVIAAFLALAAIGAVALLPWPLLPATIADMSRTEQAQWTTAWATWSAVALAATAAAAWAAGDSWRRLRLAPAFWRSRFAATG